MKSYGVPIQMSYETMFRTVKLGYNRGGGGGGFHVKRDRVFL